MSSVGKSVSSGVAVLEKPAIPDYEMLRVVGRGAYGDVWLGRGLTGVYRAIKVVWRHRFSEPGPYDREFRGMSEFAPLSLGTPGQLALLHIGRNEAEGFFYYVMELADDVETGSEVQPDRYVPSTLLELRRRQGRLPAAECLELAAQLTDGLAHLHARNLIHRDIKPSNVVLIGGRPKLADIGLISTEDDARTFVGTEGYIAPEGPTTVASDVYSLGKLFYELATGRDRREFPILPEGLDEFPDRREFLQLNGVILRACERDMSLRYENAGALLEDLQALQRGQKVRPRRRRLRASQVALVAVLAAGIVVPSTLWWHSYTAAAAVRAATAARPSIAVLPFPVDQDSPNAFFVDGMHEDLVTNLAKIRELRVTSKSAVSAYREKQRDLAAIGRDLAVAHVLTGEMHREGEQLRLTVTLTRIQDGKVLWHDMFERQITDVFAIQSELAERIADTLQAKLSSSERELIKRPATKSEVAYDLYLKARAQDQGLGNHVTLSQFKPVIEGYEAAIKEDREFALAYAQLSMVHSKLYWFNRLDDSEGRLSLAKQAADSAKRLAPNAPETRLAQGKLDYGARDFDRALQEFKAAEASIPNDEQVLSSIAYTLRRTGKWEESLPYIHRAWALNPRATTVNVVRVNTQLVMRRYSQAAAAADDFLRAEARSPNLALTPDEYSKQVRDHRSIAAYRVIANYEANSNKAAKVSGRDPYRDAYLNGLDLLPEDPNDRDRLIDKYLSAYRRSKWADADAILEDKNMKEVINDWTGSTFTFTDYSILARARVAFLSGNHELARKYADLAKAKYRNPSKPWRDRYDAWVAIRVAEADAYCGQASEAIHGIEVARAAIAKSRDVIDALVIEPIIGRIYIVLNQQNEAIASLSKMLGGVCEFGPQEIRHDPFWSRLGDDPRFEQILQSAKPL